MFAQFNDVLTVPEACRALSMGKNSLYRFLKEEKLNSIKVGNKYLIPKVYLIDFINSNRNNTFTM